MALTTNQKDMLHYLKCRYLEGYLNNYLALHYPVEMEVGRYSYGGIGNNIKFLVLYSPLRTSKSRVRAWKALVALEEKGYIFGFYINKYGSLNKLRSGISDAERWTYAQSLRNTDYDEIDKGDVIVYFTPKGLKANTKLTDYTRIMRHSGLEVKKVDLLKKDKKVKKNVTGAKLIDELVKLVYADSDFNLKPIWGVGIINQKQFVDENTAVNYEQIKQSIKNKLKEKRGY